MDLCHFLNRVSQEHPRVQWRLNYACIIPNLLVVKPLAQDNYIIIRKSTWKGITHTKKSCSPSSLSYFIESVPILLDVQVKFMESTLIPLTLSHPADYTFKSYVHDLTSSHHLHWLCRSEPTLFLHCNILLTGLSAFNLTLTSVSYMAYS